MKKNRKSVKEILFGNIGLKLLALLLAILTFVVVLF